MGAYDDGPYDDRPWLAAYPPDVPASLTLEHPDLVAMLRAWRADAPDAVAVRYFDGALTVAELDRLSDALAVGLARAGFATGDRLALYLQNVPQFVVGLLAAWKAGGIAVPVNPMNRARELAHVLHDADVRALLCLEHLHEDVARDVVPGTAVRLVVTTSELEHQSEHDPRLFAEGRRLRPPDTVDLAQLLAEHDGAAPPPDGVRASSDVAVLTYTSGTTGRPKGAMNTHANLAFAAELYRTWARLGRDDVILGVAPLFHITGLTGHIGASLLARCPLVLAHRFEPHVVVDAIRRYRPTFTVGSITVFIALMNLDGLDPADLASLRTIYSGGAPIPAGVADAYRARFGAAIHNIYGLTEATGPTHAVPLGGDTPVDPASGALSVGVPVPDTELWVVDDDGREVPPGELGELVVRGPQVVAGYWGRPEDTAAAMPEGRLHTGDVGFMRPDGWCFVVDRKKDMINAAGYKVWPREVEDVLYEHPAVREAAVVGMPDEYRGESVRAVVSLKPGTTATADELRAFCRERLAAYKCPRRVDVVDELPKTVTGKILRRELRDQPAPPA